MEQEHLLLESLEREAIVQRRQLLPTWIKVFIWIFIVFGGLGILGFVGGLFSARFEASLFGLETNDPSSPVGLFICFLFVFKGIAALALWMEKDWAVDLAIADALLGIGVCTAVMLLPLVYPASKFSFRLELLLLIPYLLKLISIRKQWKHAGRS